MAASDVKLLGTWASPLAARVQIALKCKCIDYEFIQEDFFNKSELLLNSNPVHKKIPVLIHANKPVCEPLVIIQYIDEVWNDTCSILPSDHHDRAIARFWAAYIDDKWFPLMMQLRKAKEVEESASVIEKLFEDLILLEEAFVECSKGKAFFGGDNIGYLDIALGSHLPWLRLVDMMANVKMLDEAKTPGLVGWAERFWLDEAVKHVLPEPEKLVEYQKIFQAKAKEAGMAL